MTDLVGVSKCGIVLQLNIHKFKVVARFGLMHVVATNLCIWIRTLARESVEEISEQNILTGEGHVIHELIRYDFSTLNPLFVLAAIPPSEFRTCPRHQVIPISCLQCRCKFITSTKINYN